MSRRMLSPPRAYEERCRAALGPMARSHGACGRRSPLLGWQECSAGQMLIGKREHRTSNAEHPTPNRREKTSRCSRCALWLDVRRSMLNVRCSMFELSSLSPHWAGGIGHRQSGSDGACGLALVGRDEFAGIHRLPRVSSSSSLVPVPLHPACQTRRARATKSGNSIAVGTAGGNKRATSFLCRVNPTSWPAATSRSPVQGCAGFP